MEFITPTLEEEESDIVPPLGIPADLFHSGGRDARVCYNYQFNMGMMSGNNTYLQGVP